MKKQHFLLLMLAFVVLSWLSSAGIHFGDEFVYAQKAIDILKGDFHNTGHHFDNRFGLLLPTALAVSIFGSHYSVFFIFPLLCFVLIAYTVYYVVSKEKPKLALITLLLLCINPALLRLASDISVDLVMTAALTVALMLSYTTRRQNSSSLLGGIGVGLALFYAVFTKMTALFCFPFFALLLYKDLRNKKFLLFWKTVIATSILLYISYFAAYEIMTGDFLYRFRGLEKTHGNGAVVPWNYRNRSFTDILTRITVYPLAFFLYAPGYGVIMLLAVYSIIRQRLLRTEGLLKYCTVYFLLTTSFFWFGSSSLNQYNPVILAERMFLPVLPAAAILAAYLFVAEGKKLSSSKNKIKNAICLAAIACCLLLAFLRPDKSSGLAASGFTLFLLLLSDKYWNENKYLPLFFTPLVMLILFRIIFIVPTIPYFKERKFFLTLAQSNEQSLILSDHRSVEMHSAYFDFFPPKNVIFKEFDSIPNTNIQTFLHLNTQRIPVLKAHGHTIFDLEQIKNTPKKEIFRGCKTSVYELQTIE